MKVVCYVGCYTNATQEGIHIFEVDTEQGTFQPVGSVRDTINATYLALTRNKKYLYAVQGMTEYGAPAQYGAVAAYAVEGKSLRLLNHKPIGGTPPCYVALDPAERAVVFAEYPNAISGVFELQEDGRLSDAPPHTVRHVGQGADPKRQSRAHAHCAVVSPDGKNLCVVDLGLDRVRVYDFRGRATGLKAKPTLDIVSVGGAGPRHLVFHPNGRWAFLLHELNNTMSSFCYTGEAFVHVQTLPMLPAELTVSSKAGALKVSADGRRLFGSNRGYESIVTYDIDLDTGHLTFLALSPLAGKATRDFEFMPGEKFMLLGHQSSNELRAYAYDAAKGTFTPAHAPYVMPSPVCIVFGERC